MVVQVRKHDFLLNTSAYSTMGGNNKDHCGTLYFRGVTNSGSVYYCG
jgi:hypothetical protein